MKFIEHMLLFMFIEAAMLGSTIGLFADEATAHFVRTSPWMLLYYGYFGFLVALALRINRKLNG